MLPRGLAARVRAGGRVLRNLAASAIVLVVGFGVIAVFFPRSLVFWGVGAVNTFILFAGSSMLGLAIGFFVGWGRSSGIWPLSLPLLAYVEVLRGIPRIVIVLAAVVVFPRIGLGIDWAVLWGIITLGVSSSAYQGEVFRSGFQSIVRGQIEAARSLGLTQWQTMQYVTLPQVMRTILPPLGNEWVVVLKDTSLLIVLPGVARLRIPDVIELMKVAQTVQQSTFVITQWPIIFAATAIVYLAMTLFVSGLIRYAEGRFRVPGLGVMPA
jgi:glutamine transport system permease protein